MLSRLLRSAVTLMILTVMTVAGLPFVVCVSEAHGAAIEFGDRYADHHDNSQTHRTLFGAPDNTLASGSCADFRLDRGILVKQNRIKQPAVVLGAGNDGTAFAALASSPLHISRFIESKAISRVNRPIIRSSLSDLRTIVLLI